MGMIEIPQFAKGTKAIIDSLVEHHRQGVNTIACGGDTIVLIEKGNLMNNFTHVSMGGGASLELLSGKELPGIECLKN
jgi:phosphoglycerate kinase